MLIRVYETAYHLRLSVRVYYGQKRLLGAEQIPYAFSKSVKNQLAAKSQTTPTSTMSRSMARYFPTMDCFQYSSEATAWCDITQTRNLTLPETNVIFENQTTPFGIYFPYTSIFHSLDLVRLPTTANQHSPYLHTTPLYRMTFNLMALFGGTGLNIPPTTYPREGSEYCAATTASMPNSQPKNIMSGVRATALRTITSPRISSRS